MNYYLHDLEKNTTDPVNLGIWDNIKQYLMFNFGYWGIYQILKTDKNEYCIIDKQDGFILYIVNKRAKQWQ